MIPPADIPEDVWQLAVLHGGTSMNTQADRLIIARAILADRAGRISFAGLTPRQGECLQFIASHQEQNGGVSPSYRDIADYLGLSSVSGVVRLIDGLEARGRILRPANRSRAITIIANPAN